MTVSRTTRRRHPPPLSVRLSADEHRKLKLAAKGRSISDYVRARLFVEFDVSGDHAAGLRESPADTVRLLAQILAALGRSRLAASFAEMAEAARLGILPVTPETATAFRQAFDDIAGMRAALLRALGLRLSTEAEDDPER